MTQSNQIQQLIQPFEKHFQITKKFYIHHLNDGYLYLISISKNVDVQYLVNHLKYDPTFKNLDISLFNWNKIRIGLWETSQHYQKEKQNTKNYVPIFAFMLDNIILKKIFQHFNPPSKFDIMQF